MLLFLSSIKKSCLFWNWACSNTKTSSNRKSLACECLHFK